MAKNFTKTPDVPRIEKGVTLFRSCLVSAEYPGVESSTKWLFERLGIEYTVNPAQTCCTGLGYYSDLMPIQTTVGIAARNACVVVDDEHPVMSYLCYTCQSRCPRHNSVAVINQVIRGMQVESGRGRLHVEMFAEWCGTFYEKGMGGDPHLLFPAIGEVWGEKWTDFMAHLLETREDFGLGDLFPPDEVVKEVQTIFEETGIKARLAAVRGEDDGTGSD